MGLGRLRIVSKKVSNTLFSLVNKGYCPFQVDATNAQSTSTNYTRVAPLASLHNASPQCLNQTTSSSSTFNSSQVNNNHRLLRIIFTRSFHIGQFISIVQRSCRSNEFRRRK
ncbi:unnamed protein product [Rotaria sordida]|uniref:Uncharacterized protein n=1 Tax=Rotaria sordida TaxID=392033 RepID=A0A815D322_9BILA|nr:unnamed protein product [Rotaria sordida]